MLQNKRILLIISGGIAAYKSLELIRGLKKSGASVRCILTQGGSQFVTPLSVAALSEEQVYTDLWSLKDETEMGHIRLSRECDLIVVAPASANIIARIANGLADDLASTTILASDKQVMICPAMNPQMWENAATKYNIETLKKRGVIISGPAAGEMACGEIGYGRLLEPDVILNSIHDFFLSHDRKSSPLSRGEGLDGGIDTTTAPSTPHLNPPPSSWGRTLDGLTAIVTSGPTYEAIDPVRFVGNRSSGKQGHAIASALADLGASVTLITGPTNLNDPSGVKTIRIESARQMLDTCQKHLPADIAVCAAAVADWAPKNYQSSKIKKTSDTPVTLKMTQNPDILSTLSKSVEKRPRLVIGFAAETDNLVDNAKTKRAKKGCDWIVANSVSAENPVFGADENQVYFIASDKVEEWPRASKDDVAKKLATRIAEFFDRDKAKQAAE